MGFQSEAGFILCEIRPGNLTFYSYKITDNFKDSKLGLLYRWTTPFRRRLKVAHGYLWERPVLFLFYILGK